MTTMITTHPAIRAALRGHAPSDEQLKVIEYRAEPLAVIAGAGAGKTAVMAARMAHLVVTGQARPSQILGLAFTNKAAHELRERIQLALEHVPTGRGEEPSVFTYHSFADRVLRDYGAKIGIEPESALLSEAQAYMLMARLLEEVTFERLRVTWVPGIVAHARQLAENCANHLKTPEEVVEEDARIRAEYEATGKKMQNQLADLIRNRPDLCKLVRAFLDRKRELGRIDYGDQIAFAYKVVFERPEVADALRERWPVVLLDEYQDTNIAQRRMIESIYPAGSAITVVGDPDQAIYAWRGATLYNILHFGDHFRNRDGSRAPSLPLQVSFRSGRRILAAANAIISAIPASSRGGEKELRHHEPTGDGEVTVDLLSSEADEAKMIAGEINALAGDDGIGLQRQPLPYREVAILCRSRRLFRSIQRALRDAQIPVEVVGLGGLLTVPEVVDLLAYLRLLVKPWDNVAFARIAMGPRWRIHYRDLASLARWAAANTGRLKQALQERDTRWGEVDPGEERFSLYEALSRLHEIEEVSEEARVRLSELQGEIEATRSLIAAATLGEAVERVLVASGIEDELTVADTDVARSARGNLGSFLDRAAAFSPLEGEASIEAFLEYLDAARETEDLEVAQPQQNNAVKLMTIHQAKGLEFDLVFIPGLAEGLFPNTKVTDNPMKSIAELPYTLREDEPELPRFEKVMTSFEQKLKERALEEERRLAYVAMTRARKGLRLSAAHWYGERKTRNEQGVFFVELAGGRDSGDGEARAPHHAVTVRRRDPAPERNPLREEWKLRAEAWPPPDEDGDDPLFENGWRAAAEAALSHPHSVEQIVARAGVERGDYERARALVAEQLEIVSQPGAPPKPDQRLRSLSVSSLVQLARCPKQFYWSVVRPLPRRPSGAARLGQEIHRWIEIRSIGQQRLDDPEELPDLSPEEVADVATGVGARSPDSLKHAFESSRFATIRPRATEEAFVIALDGGFLVRGRIDAIYEHADGTWEIVDYKTGNEPDASDTTTKLQLAIYAIAARQVWRVERDKLRLTYFYLSSGTERSYEAAELDVSEDDLLQMFETVEVGSFDPVPGRICFSCDFLRFCSTGRAHVASVEAAREGGSGG